MNPRLPALASIIVGLIGLALTAVVWPIAVPLGIFALALYAVTRIVKPTTSTDRWFATGGLLFGLLAVVLGAAIAINDSGGDGGSTPKSAASHPAFPCSTRSDRTYSSCFACFIDARCSRSSPVECARQYRRRRFE